ncbi:hypothetical protein AC1031_021015 [Aphanomyces cochlioides]|nr:hypothetical protein AC1031_021015 [Aphanomyces cochlioides]
MAAKQSRATDGASAAASAPSLSNPLHQIHHLTKEMSKAVALNVDTTMRTRTLTSISHAQRSNSEPSSSGSESSSAESSPNTSPTSLVSTMPLPEDGQVPPKPQKTSPRRRTASAEALLMPGRAFLESFYMFLKQHAKSLRVRNPRLQVLLNPPCLYYLEGCFNAMLVPSWSPETGALLQWQAKKDDAEVADQSDKVQQGMSKTNRMLKLAGYVLNVIDLSIKSLPDAMLLPSTCNLAIFSSLLYLAIDGVDLEDIQNLSSLRKQLVELRISHCHLPDLVAVLGDTTTPWTSLKHLRVVGCGLSKLDPTLALVPHIQTLVVARNHLQTLSHLENCPHLTRVDVSQNKLTAVAGAHRYLANVTHLDVSCNELTSTSGLEKMLGLQSVDLRGNQLVSTTEIASLVSLPLLQTIDLEGNPFVDAPYYRTRVLEHLGKDVVVDQTPWTEAELALFDRLHHPTIDVEHDVTLPRGDSPAASAKSMSWTASRILLAVSAFMNEILGRAVMLCCLLVVAHVSAQWIWPRDALSDARDSYMAWTEAYLAVIALATALPVYAIPLWMKKAPRTSKTPLSPRLTTQLSFNAQTQATIDETQLPPASLDILSTALEILVEKATEMPLHDFISMVGEVSKLVEFLGPPAAFAAKTWPTDEAILHQVWTQHRRSSTISIPKLVHDDTERHQSHSITRTLLRIVPVLMFVRSLCLELEKDATATLQHCLSEAYSTTIAKHNKHAWLVQKTVLSTIQLSSLTRENLLHMWDLDEDEPDVELKEQRLHACGRMLDMIVVQLAKLRDVYNIHE